MANLADLTLKVTELGGATTDLINSEQAKFQQLKDLISQLKAQIAAGDDTQPVINQVQAIINAVVGEEAVVDGISVS